jgi:hypothetical protein
MNNVVSDSSEYLRIGSPEVTDYIQIEMAPMGMSYENDYPSNFKVAGYSFMRSLDQVQVTRRTYDLLDFGKDLGGLDKILMTVFSFLVGHFSKYNLQNQIIGNLYMSKGKKRSLNDQSPRGDRFEQDLQEQMQSEKLVGAPQLSTVMWWLFTCKWARVKH